MNNTLKINGIAYTGDKTYIDILDIIFDTVDELNEIYKWKHNYPDLTNYNTVQLLSFYHQLASQLP